MRSVRFLRSVRHSPVIHSYVSNNPREDQLLCTFRAFLVLLVNSIVDMHAFFSLVYF